MKFSWVTGKVTSSPIDSSLLEWQTWGCEKHINFEKC